MAAERIVIIVSEQGTETVIRKLKGVGDTAKTSGDSVSFLRNALGLLGSAVTLKGFIGLLDAFTEIQNKIKTVSASQEEAAVATQKLLDVANRSRTSFEDIATLYQRVVRSTEQLGISHAKSARIVETLSKATIVGGASATEASAALIQLSQGFSAGVLRGQELRSVMTQIPLVADILAKKLDTTIGGLLQLGPQGKITAQVMADALVEAADRIDEAFAKTTPTIGQQLNVLKNNLIKFAGELNTKFNIVPRINAAIQFLSDNIDSFARGVLAGVFVIGITKAIQALNLLTAAIAANPIGFIAVAITAAVAALITFSDQIKLTSDGAATLADFFAVAFEEAGKDIEFLADIFEENFGFISDFLKDIFGKDLEFSVKGFLKIGAKAIDSFVGIFVGAAGAIIVAFKNIPASLEIIFKTMINSLLAQIEFFINSFVKAVNVVADSSLGKKLGLDKIGEVALPRLQLSKEAKITGEDIAKEFAAGFNSVTDAQDFVEKVSLKAEGRAQDRERLKRESADSLKRGQEEFERTRQSTEAALSRAAAIDTVVEKLNDENEALSRVINSRVISSDYVRIELGLRKKGIELTDKESEHIQSILIQNESLKEQAKIYEQIVGPQEEYARTQQALNELVNKGKISQEQYGDALRQAQIRQLESNRDVASGFSRGFLKIQEDITNFAKLSEDVVTNAFSNMEDALVEFVKSGELNFSSLIDSMLADLTRLVFRQALSGLASSFGGPLGGIFSALGGARAEGGPVSPGKAYVVGERGPEIFQPSSSGTIIPNGAAGGGPANVTVVNVTSMDEVSAYLSSPEAGDKIVNHIRRNRSAVKQAIG